MVFIKKQLTLTWLSDFTGKTITLEVKASNTIKT